MSTSELSAIQLSIYECIRSSLSQRGYPPTVREIGSAVGISSPSVVYGHLRRLEEVGVIEQEKGQRRAIRLAGGTAVSARSDVRQIPLLKPETADVNAYTGTEVETHLAVAIPGQSRLFAIRMPDEAMLDAGILTGDIVVFQAGTEAKDGELTAVQMDGVLTVRRWKLRRGIVWLLTENPEYPACRAGKTVPYGKAVLLLRHFG